MILILIILSLVVLMDAFGDAMRFRDKQIIHHSTEVVVVALWVWLLYLVNTNPISLHDLAWSMIYMVSFRIAFFDQLFNLFARLHPFHIGNTSLWDKLMNRGGSILKVMALFTILASFIRLFKY